MGDVIPNEALLIQQFFEATRKVFNISEERHEIRKQVDDVFAIVESAYMEVNNYPLAVCGANYFFFLVPRNKRRYRGKNC